MKIIIENKEGEIKRYWVDRLHIRNGVIRVPKDNYYTSVAVEKLDNVKNMDIVETNRGWIYVFMEWIQAFLVW